MQSTFFLRLNQVLADSILNIEVQHGCGAGIVAGCALSAWLFKQRDDSDEDFEEA